LALQRATANASNPELAKIVRTKCASRLVAVSLPQIGQIAEVLLSSAHFPGGSKVNLCPSIELPFPIPLGRIMLALCRLHRVYRCPVLLPVILHHSW
jgi:hypothetical protein